MVRKRGEDKVTMITPDILKGIIHHVDTVEDWNRQKVIDLVQAPAEDDRRRPCWVKLLSQKCSLILAVMKIMITES